MKVSNPNQATYATGAGTRTVHIHHTKPALLDLIMQELQDEDDPPAPQPLGYLPSAFTHKLVDRDQARGASSVITPQPSQPPSLLRGLVTGPLVGPVPHPPIRMQQQHLAQQQCLAQHQRIAHQPRLSPSQSKFRSSGVGD